MKDVAHHLKRLQREVIRESRREVLESTLQRKNPTINGGAQAGTDGQNRRMQNGYISRSGS